MVNRYAAYKTMAQVRKGTIVLAFCWDHVRRDFVAVGRSSSDHREWVLAWLERIRELYQCDRQHHGSQPGGADEFCSADSTLRQTVTAMRAQADAELADTKLAPATWCWRAFRSTGRD